MMGPPSKSGSTPAALTASACSSPVSDEMEETEYGQYDDGSTGTGDLGPGATGSGGGMLLAGLAKVFFSGDLETFMLIAAPAVAGAITYWWTRISDYVSVGVADYLEQRERVRFYRQSRETLRQMRAGADTSARRRKELDAEIEKLDRIFSDSVGVVFRSRMRRRR
jgi:hypothetical protein